MTKQLQRRELPSVSMQHIHAEKLLGSGSFAVVYAVTLDAPQQHQVLQAQHSSEWPTATTTMTTTTTMPPQEAPPTKTTTPLLRRKRVGRPRLLIKSGSLSSMDSGRTAVSHSSSRSSNSSSSSSSRRFMTTTTTTTTTTATSSPLFAIKRLKGQVVLNDRQRGRASRDLSREAHLLQTLPSHPHLIRLYGLSPDFDACPDSTGDDDNNDNNDIVPPKYWVGGRFLLLEQLQAQTLEDQLQEWMQQGARKIKRTTTEHDRIRQAQLLGVVQALQFLHAHGILYRDLKPHNIGYGHDGRVKLFDFGLARSVVSRQQEEQQPLLTACVGTLCYMAPEVAIPTNDDDTLATYDHRADLFSVGALLWELCVLQHPYGNPKSAAQLEEWVITGNKNRPTARPIKSPQLKPLIEACLQRNPRQRPASCQTIIAVLQQLD